MSYSPFGRRFVRSTIDNGSHPFNNKGNPTAVFTPSDLKLPQGQFEVQKAAIIGGPIGITFQVFIDTYPIDSGQLDTTGAAAFYKASDGEFIITNQSEIYFYFASAQGTLLPSVTMWLVYDPALTVNRAIFSTQGYTP